MNDLGDAARASVIVRVASGSVVEELVSAAKDADMLVVGSRGAGGFRGLVMGSVHHLLVTQHATCPVVVIPAADLQVMPPPAPLARRVDTTRRCLT